MTSSANRQHYYKQLFLFVFFFTSLLDRKYFIVVLQFECLWETLRTKTEKRTGLGRFPTLEKEMATPVFLPGESYRQRSLVGYNPQGQKESDTTELHRPPPPTFSYLPSVKELYLSKLIPEAGVFLQLLRKSLFTQVPFADVWGLGYGSGV